MLGQMWIGSVEPASLLVAFLILVVTYILSYERFSGVTVMNDMNDMKWPTYRLIYTFDFPFVISLIMLISYRRK